MTPDVIICIPTIKRDIDNNILIKTAPRKGDAIIMIDKTIDITPATILNILDALLLDLSAIPWITLDIPSKSRTNARNINKNIPVAIGNAIDIRDNIITRIPRPILVQRCFPLRNNPVITLSIPTTNKITASKSAIVTKVRPGKASTYKDRIMATIPNPICASLIHPGDLVSAKVMFN
jgi:hypothetical protein